MWMGSAYRRRVRKVVAETAKEAFFFEDWDSVIVRFAADARACASSSSRSCSFVSLRVTPRNNELERPF